jgi:quinol monooxygenase YgiN
MLIRIVRMHFTPDGKAEFLKTFSRHRTAIGSFPGCTHLSLLRDLRDVNCLTTLSHWNTEEDLEAYRQSELFTSVWASVKPLFAKQPQAYSMEEVEV